ncbi:MAG TPA: hypothetical protein VGQ57_18425 [Polyangiaceae bacterium]|jgi:hypothetical protein|nr:hypothetical protein [Polyangiaceae bacterium]
MSRTASSAMLVALCAPLALGACASDDPGTGPLDQCNALTSQYCTTLIDCQISGGTLTEDARDDAMKDCESAAAKSLDCSRAIGVSDFYDSCLDDLRNLDCDELNQSLMDGSFMLPGPCTSVIIIE